ncbi:hypothetical protein PIB30_048760 [Stylosanthes scabra]|uniref:Putative plant transposon protein domain-containing protein n=1 Tax=Stylosanthes scabra TaxID=79078 RepID=A0ABU6SH16_9FABA|nr:hypothetical protein [Stylosanthes scabra]
MAALFSKKRKGKAVAESSNEAPRKDPLPNAASYEERKANKDYRLEEVLECLCLKGREWVRHKDGRPHFLRRNDLEPMARGWYDFVCRSIMPTTNRSELTVERAMLIHSIIIGENINVEEIIAEQFYKFIYKTDLSSSLPFPSIIAALCLDAKIVPHKDDTMIPQEIPIAGEAMMSNETMYYPYQNTAKQFREMEAQGVPMTIANLAIHRHREEEMNWERMRHNQTVQEAASQRAKETNKGKVREVVPDSEEEESEEMYSSPSEECQDDTMIPHKDDTMIPQEIPIAGEAMMSNETMYYPYQNTAKQFREMEAQDVPMTIANLAIHRHREEEMNRERMRHNQTVQEAASQRTREANKGKAREVVPDSEEEESEEMYSSPSEEW